MTTNPSSYEITAQQAQDQIRKIEKDRQEAEIRKRNEHLRALEQKIAPYVEGEIGRLRPWVFQAIQQAVSQEYYCCEVAMKNMAILGEPLSEKYLLELSAYEAIMRELGALPYDFDVKGTVVQVSEQEIGRDYSAERCKWTISWR